MKLSIRSTSARWHGTSNSTQSGRADTTSIARATAVWAVSLVQELDQRLWLDGLRHVPPRLFATHFEPRFRRVVRGHHDDFGARPFFGQRGQHVQSVHFGIHTSRSIKCRSRRPGISTLLLRPSPTRR